MAKRSSKPASNKPVANKPVTSKSSSNKSTRRNQASKIRKSSARQRMQVRSAATSPAPVRLAHRIAITPTETQAYRELFWQNVLREVLVSLIMLRVPTEHAVPLPGPVPEPNPAAVLDGRLGLITMTGQRIPIAAVYPVFSASVPSTSKTLTLSAILQSTVFQIHTPGGEVYTLPLHEIRGFHALTEELMDQLAASARSHGEGAQADGSEVEPFGFAAFTSMARGKMPADMSGLDDNDDEPSGAD
jgi:hypothetical protein